MKEFFEFMAVPMQKPTSYGVFHLLFGAFLIALAITLAFLLRKTTEKQNKIVLIVVGSLLIVFEVLKQLFYYYFIGNGSYQWWIFPFQLCSVPMYLCVIIPLIKSEKVKKWFYEFMFAINMLGGIMAFIEPSGINHEWLFLTLHAYVWHAMLIFLGLYLYFSKRACTTKMGYLKSLAVFAGMIVIAQILNVSIRQPGFNMFYVSPFEQSPLAVFSMFYEKLGWFPNMLLYILAIALGSAAIYFSFYLFRKIKKNKHN